MQRESGGARLLQNGKVKAAIRNHQEKLAEKIDITAETMLRDTIRFRDIAFGDLPAIHEQVVKDPETGDYREVVYLLRQFNPQALGKALELIGRHTQVQAFRDTVEHTHTHRLEQALARRSKEVEKAALERTLVLVE